MSSTLLRSYKFKGIGDAMHVYSSYAPSDWPRHDYNKSILAAGPMPDRIRTLPVSEKGYPIPWFVSWVDEKPEFRAVSHGRIKYALTRGVCWICGHKLGTYKAFVLGPMCTITRTSAECPTHKDCAEFAVKTCPFMVNPRMVRNEVDLPGSVTCPGTMIQRNPGVIAIWTTRDWTYRQNDENGILIAVGDPTSVDWYSFGQLAGFQDVLLSLGIGVPILADEAAKNGVSGLLELANQLTYASRYFPCPEQEELTYAPLLASISERVAMLQQAVVVSAPMQIEFPLT